MMEQKLLPFSVPLCLCGSVARLSLLLSVFVVAGCAPRTEPEPGPAAAAESTERRLDNQARAIAELSAENGKLLVKVAELTKEIERLTLEVARLVAPK